MVVSRGVPVGVLLLQKCCSLGQNRRLVYQTSVLVLTFIAYSSFHMSRRPLAVVKNSLNQDCGKLTPPPGLVLDNVTRHNWCDWAPFNGSDANRLLGVLDSVYLFAYAICMFLSGVIAERIDLRYYLALGMLVSGLFTYLFGVAYYLDIHNFAFFVVVQIFAGAVQCTGWPGVVSCVGNWFGKARRGLIFGIWNAHLYVGNILGAYVAGYFVANNWGLSFIVPGATVGVVGFIIFLFLVPHPEDVECCETNHHGPSEVTEDAFFPGDQTTQNQMVSKSNSANEKSPLTHSCTESSPSRSQRQKKQAITFWKALQIPGVLEFSLCLFFSKLVSYTFLFWLPRYLAHSTGGGSQASAYLSIAFDVGGIIGGVVAGIVSDHTGANALTCVGFLGLAVPSLFIFEAYGSVSNAANIILQLLCGALVNGPYALITTAVSTELGTHKSIRNSKALSTVTAIIDGTGSIGAAIGPLMAGLISEFSWSYVFYMMMLADFFALLSLLRTARRELMTFFSPDYGMVLPSFKCSPCCKTEETYENIER